MTSIAFFDFEVNAKTGEILDIGSIRSDQATFHKKSVPEFLSFVSGSGYLCGHNIIQHDLKYLPEIKNDPRFTQTKIIDTLFLSPLLFPLRPYHRLVKDDKLHSDDLNNPLNDSIKAKDLFYDEVSAFHLLDDRLKAVFYLLLANQKEFNAFFNFISYIPSESDLPSHILSLFHEQICEKSNLLAFIENDPIELAYCLSLIHCNDRYSITPHWILKCFPRVETIMNALRNKPCLTGCAYCDRSLDIHEGLKRFFGFSTYRSFNGKPLQEEAVRTAVQNKSLLAVFPTGGGKSVTFQVPALMSGVNTKSLTVVISPLQSLMKDQVDNLEKAGITEAVTINGLLDPIERAKSFERVDEGLASLLYIAPESLRSEPIRRLLLGRKIARFVIDEAHCLSAWGQDFRVDYLYIGDFIRKLQQDKNLDEPIPVSCFTATAKQKVVEDICAYFREKLSIDLVIIKSNASRTNLHYQVFEKGNEEDKYNATRDLVDGKNCPAIVYVSRTRKAYELAERLNRDGYNARPYHGKMDVQEKSANQNAFISGEAQIMVATSAFGMGVDKKDVGLVIHHDVSDSLENYIQEAGRAGRDESIEADCFVLFNEDDLNKHFILLNQTKLGIKEIQQVWKAIKEITRFRTRVSGSALEIARKAGWDDNVVEIETRVTTAIAALEEAGYIRRGQNMPKLYANSILTKNAQEAIDKITRSEKFSEKQKVKAVRIVKKLFSSKSRIHSNDEVPECRVDYISDHLGIVKEEVIEIIGLLREEQILADKKDLTAFIFKGENKKRSVSMVQSFNQIEMLLMDLIPEQEGTLNIKELNELLLSRGIMDASPGKIKTILTYWAIKNWIRRRNLEYSSNLIQVVGCHPKEVLEVKLRKRQALATFIIDLLFQKSLDVDDAKNANKDVALVEFSVHELKDTYSNSNLLFKEEISVEDVEDTLFYLSRIEALKIEGGFLVTYNRLSLERLEQDTRKRYKAEDYQKLAQFYENKIQQIHIVGEYAKKMLTDYKGALQFADDYFQLNYTSFLNKYFPGSRQDDLKKSLTPEKFKRLFGELSPAQLGIIKDQENKTIAVAAGPGSGKTRVLVHKLASIIMIEDVKYEQLLMITFSRAAATEFKKRLFSLIGNAANFVEIRTFHSYCFDLQGKIGSLEKSDSIIRSTLAKIESGDVEPSRLTKTMLVIDEAQDMDESEFRLICALMSRNEDMRVIAVGDDDQNIYSFRGSDSKYLEQFILQNQAVKYELVENFRSTPNLVEFTNAYVAGIKHRLKGTPIIATQKDPGPIHIIQYKHGNLIRPLVAHFLTQELAGTTCILTVTNEEAFQVTGLLNQNHIPARLIQAHDSFDIYNIDEIRYFLHALNPDGELITIDDESWSDAKRELIQHYKTSSKLELCLNLIDDFEKTNTKKKYFSDLVIFIKESRMEDFIHGNSEMVTVSTIHKVKGKEFQHVFLLLDGYHPVKDEEKRLLYVAMTRAKEQLVIHYNGTYLENIQADHLQRSIDENCYEPPELLVLHLTHEDVNLGYFEFVQHRLKHLRSGDKLKILEDGCSNAHGEPVLKFSRKFLDMKEARQKQGFLIHEAVVNFMLCWKKKDTETEFMITLPTLVFQKG